MKVPCLCSVSLSYQKSFLFTRATERQVEESGTAGKKKEGKMSGEAEEARVSEQE